MISLQDFVRGLGYQPRDDSDAERFVRGLVYVQIELQAEREQMMRIVGYIFIGVAMVMGFLIGRFGG